MDNPSTNIIIILITLYVREGCNWTLIISNIIIHPMYVICIQSTVSEALETKHFRITRLP